MNRRHFLKNSALALFGFTVLPPATTYGRIWKAQRAVAAYAYLPDSGLWITEEIYKRYCIAPIWSTVMMIQDFPRKLVWNEQAGDFDAIPVPHSESALTPSPIWSKD